MKPTNRIRSQLNECEELIRALRTSAPHARANWQAWSGLGYPSSAGIRGSGVSKPVERTALAALESSERDRFYREWQHFDQHLTDAMLLLRKAQRLALSATNTTVNAGAQGCRVCERCRVDGRPHLEHWQEPYSKGLCSFCYDWEERYGVTPAPAITEYHLSNLGKRIPVPMIRDHHPEEYARVHGQRRAS